MNVFMFSSFVSDRRTRKMVEGSLSKKTIAYIPAFYGADSRFHGSWGYYDLGFRSGMQFPLGIHYNEQRKDMLYGCDAIHIGGGNTFELLFMLKARGMLEELRQYVVNGGVLFGSSAGSIVMCPDISIAKFADDNWLGLAGDELNSICLVDFYMKPHWESWKKRKEDFKNFSRRTGKEVYGLRETQGIHISDWGIDFIGGCPKHFKP